MRSNPRLAVAITIVSTLAVNMLATPVIRAQSTTPNSVDDIERSLPEQTVTAGAIVVNDVDNNDYKIPSAEVSEFDHWSGVFLKDWRAAAPTDEYEDTEFGELMYNESSTPTKLEMLRLLSKDTPSVNVFLHALSMGVDLEDMLQAAVRYEPSRGRDLATAAITTIPLLDASNEYVYSTYGLDDLTREQESDSYRVEEVATRFFDDREVLTPAPDWFEGQFHFLASAAELDRLQKTFSNVRWYRSKSKQTFPERPIFVSLYENSDMVLIDGDARISAALASDSEARLPVVFIFNKLNERPIDQLGYPATIRGVQAAYTEEQLMVTPTPEWQSGEYHLYADLDEFYSIFELPEEDDFEPEAWQKLVAEAKKYSVPDTSFLFVVLGSKAENVAKLAITSDQLYAAWDDPRTEGRFPYVRTNGEDSADLAGIVDKGLIFNRPDLIAALRFLGVTQVPVSFYYIDDSRVNAYVKSPRALIQAAIGAGTPTGSFGGGGGFTPPPQVVPPASPPGVQ